MSHRIIDSFPHFIKMQIVSFKPVLLAPRGPKARAYKTGINFINRQTDRKIDRQSDIKTDRQTDIKTDKKSNRNIDRKTDRQTDIKTDIKIDRKTYINKN